MAVLFCDSFHYPGAQLGRKWLTVTGGGQVISSTGLFSGTHNCVSGDYRFRTRSPLFTETDVIMFHLRFNAGNNAQQGIISFYNGATVIGELTINTDKTMTYYQGSLATSLGTTSGALLTSQWYDLQLKVYFHSSAGTVDLLVNGSSWMALTGKNTGSTLCDNAGLGDGAALTGGNATCYYADPVIWDDNGSYNNSWPLGDVRVQPLLPSGAGNTTSNWSRGGTDSGSDYGQVDEASANDDTDYIYSSTAAAKDTFAYGNLASTSGTVKAVQVTISARKDDAGTRTIAPVYRPASTDYDGTTVTVGDSYTFYREITEVSPATSSGWTISEVNGAEFGVKLVS